MANVIIYTRNALAGAGVTLKNGTGGGAPALEESADWPMGNLLSPDRETYWRTSAAPPASVKVDFDLGSAQSIRSRGVAKQRTYGVTTNLTIWCSYIAGAGAYDPADGAWTDTGGGQGASASNSMTDFGSPITARYWRFKIDNIGQFSCKLWLVKDADRLDLGRDFNVGTEENQRRLREELTSPAGLTFGFEPAEDRGSVTRGGTLLLRSVNEATRDLLRNNLTTIDTRFLIKLGDGVVLETSLPEGQLSWSRVWAAPETFDFVFQIEEHV